MKLWKKTVLLMLVTLLVSLTAVGGLTIYITGKRSLNNAAQTYGRQLYTSARLVESFWDAGKYERMTDIGRRSYRKFQFEQLCGDGFALLKGDEVVENGTGYGIKDLTGLGMEDSGEKFDYRIQILGGKYLLLQLAKLEKPKGCTLFSVRDITEVFHETGQLALWFLGIYVVIFFVGGAFIYSMMRRTVRAMEELQEVAEKQELLLGALSHEMKTPLTSIIGYSDSLLHVNLASEQKVRALEHINREGKRLERLSGKMLQMMGLYQNQAISVEERNVHELLERVEYTEREKVEKKKVWFRKEYENFTLDMDIELMEEMLLNLVENALHASEAGDTITLRAKRTEKEKILEVQDTGHGIPKEELAKVTEAFYMVDKSRSRKQGGAGLGLAICSQIARVHGGKLEIESEVGVGTTVRVRF